MAEVKIESNFLINSKMFSEELPDIYLTTSIYFVRHILNKKL